MARIRTIKPEFWEDETVGRLSRDARLLFIACFNLADDEGRLRWSPAYVRSSAFMFDDDLSLADVWRLMEELTGAHLVTPYSAGKGDQSLAFVVNFKKHQVVNRPTPSQLPAPPTFEPDPLFDAGFLTISEPSLTIHGGLPEGREIEGKGNRREIEGKQRTVSARATAVPADFEITDAMKAWASSNVPNLDLVRETAKFKDWHTAKGSTMKDWTAAWRTWMRKATEFAPVTAAALIPATRWW